MYSFDAAETGGLYSEVVFNFEVEVRFHHTCIYHGCLSYHIYWYIYHNASINEKLRYIL